MINARTIATRAINLRLIRRSARHIRPADQSGFGKPHAPEPIAHQRHLKILSIMGSARKCEMFFAEPKRIRRTGFDQRHSLIRLQR